MLINSNATYKSLEPIQPPIGLPNFVVLSGLNGAGKSQLLAGINQNLIILSENNQRLQPVKFVDHSTLAPNDSVTVLYENLRKASQHILTQFENYKKNKLTIPALTLENVIGDAKFRKIIQDIAKNVGKEVDSLSEDDFFRHYPLEDGLNQADIFYQNFSSLFKRYQVKQYENDVNEFRNQKYGNVKYLSNDEFERIYGEPPWLFVNQIIKEASLDYHINSPQSQHPEAPFELKLVNNYNGAEINFSDLSSGEKVIMSLALSLYNSKFDIDFPKVLLMDEPDSHLHPSMTKQFLDVIQKVFVLEKGVKIIMTTHSPSTVALAPEDSLFVMNKTGARIAKTSKDKALRILTAGVPTLSISYENRRQVFVESKHDVFFYENVYEKLRSKLVPEISINFISSGVGGQGNCNEVKEIVNKLTSYGNRSIYGIIDWDKKNDGNEFVKVLGKGRRYSIENYIFDPILLAAFLYREKFIDRTTLDLGDEVRYTDFNNLPDANLQAVADVIVNQVRMKVGSPADTELQESEYMNGKKVNLPTWFLQVQGHLLEDIIKELFPELNKYRREGELKREIINKVIDDIPEFISSDILIVLKDIQNYQAGDV